MSEASYTVIYAVDALEDLRNIHSYIAVSLKAPGTATKQVNRIRNEVRTLDFMPQRYVIVDWEPWHSMGMHKLPVDNFVVFYLVDDNAKTVKIARIFYGGSDIEGVISFENK